LDFEVVESEEEADLAESYADMIECMEIDNYEQEKG
jgi:hypothetical protein